MSPRDRVLLYSLGVKRAAIFCFITLLYCLACHLTCLARTCSVNWIWTVSVQLTEGKRPFLYTTVNFISDQREIEKRCSVPPVCLPPSCQEGWEWVCHCEEGWEWICHFEVEVHCFAKGVRMDLPLQRGKSILIPIGKLTVVYKNEILPPHPSGSFGFSASLKQAWCHPWASGPRVASSLLLGGRKPMIPRDEVGVCPILLTLLCHHTTSIFISLPQKFSSPPVNPLKYSRWEESRSRQHRWSPSQSLHVQRTIHSTPTQSQEPKNRAHSSHTFVSYRVF